MKDKSKQPGISFDGILLSKENFWRVPFIPAKIKIDVDFNINLKKPKEPSNSFSNEFTTNLTCLYSNDGGNEEVAKLSFTFIGLFSVIKDKENMDIKDFMKKNSSAAIFPYVRQHISEVTQKAGMKPLIMPPVNIAALVDNIKDDFNDKQSNEKLKIEDKKQSKNPKK